jgi:hypothetical protein
MGHRELEGRSFAPTEPYAVTRDRVAEFAASTGAAYAGGAAPVTFPVVVASAAVRALVDDPGAGLTLARIVHGRQRFSAPAEPAPQEAAGSVAATPRSGEPR